jgi:putative ABC transport system substrate-binding protein
MNPAPPQQDEGHRQRSDGDLKHVGALMTFEHRSGRSADDTARTTLGLPATAAAALSHAPSAPMNATGTIPIVTAVSGDPIALGFTNSLSRPTGNITGFTTFNDTLAAKAI